VRTLLRRMGIEAIYRVRTPAGGDPEHRVFPYLLRRLAIDRPNHVWCADVAYIPMARGLVYLVGIIDWHTAQSPHLAAFQQSHGRTSTSRLEEAIAKYGVSEIFNTDQGAQFTSAEFIGVLKQHGIRISMDGCGRWRDNVFVERLWKSIKYEEGLPARLRKRLGGSRRHRYIHFFNTRRPHSALDRCTPDAVYFNSLPLAAAA
jgi:putative transposase